MSALRRSTRLKAAATVQIGPVAVNDFSVDSEDVDADQTTVQPSPKKKRKPREPKPDPVYVIPDVEKKTTSFHGRLGAQNSPRQSRLFPMSFQDMPVSTQYSAPKSRPCSARGLVG